MKRFRTILAIVLFAAVSRCDTDIYVNFSDLRLVGSGTEFWATWGSTSAWTPASLTNCVLWLDASDYESLTLSNNWVTAWADKSGRSNHTAQADSTRRRLYKVSDSVAGNRPSVSSDDGHVCYVATTSITGQQFYVVAAYKDGADEAFDDYATVAAVLDSTTERIGMGQINTASWYGPTSLSAGASKNGASSLSTTALPMPLCLLRFDFSAPLGRVWMIGSQTSAAQRGWRGPICEVVVVSSTLSLDDRIRLDNYLGAKWGITITH